MCRFFHAATCNPTKKIVYMFGGLVQSDDEDGLMYRANKEMWKFDLEKQRWSGPDVSLFVCLFVCFDYI